MEAVIEWQEDMHFSGSAGSGIEVHMDGKRHENRAGASPVELMALSLIGCTGMDVVSILQKMRQDFHKIEIKFKGDRREEHPRSFTDIHVEYVITGKDLNPERVNHAIELSVDQYCSVHAMLSKSANITHSHRIIEA